MLLQIDVPREALSQLLIGGVLVVILSTMLLQIDTVGEVLLQRLLGEWGLMHQLAILRNVFLLGCPLLVPFASALYGRLHKGQMLASLSHFELELMLQQGLADPAPSPPGRSCPAPSQYPIWYVTSCRLSR